MAIAQLSLASNKQSSSTKSGADQLTKATGPWVQIVVGYAAAASAIGLMLALLAFVVSLIRQVLAAQGPAMMNVMSIPGSALAVPVCAIAALALVTFFDLVRGRAEIEGSAVKLKGSASSVLLWLAVFLAFTVACAVLSR